MSYWRATRHPAPCLFFVLPILITYEFGVVSIGGTQALALRNGADAWMRWLLAVAGLGQGFFAPVLVILILFVWAARERNNVPTDAPNILAGMAVESIGFALVLWALSRFAVPLMDALGVELAAQHGASAAGTPLALLVTYLGAGIYEEVIFRLGLYRGAACFLRATGLPGPLGGLVAAGVSAVAFAAVHHVGANGEEMNNYVFGFRVIAGLIFTALFTYRGFGITVGTHALYDILVGVSV